MNRADAVALIADAVPRTVGLWADLGAGDGTFTRALAELLAPGSRILAVDRDARSLASLRGPSGSDVEIVPVVGDFTMPLDVPGLAAATLDGLLMANSLHYVRDAASVLARLTALLRPDGRAVFIEYDRRRANPWVPYPLSPARLAEVAQAAGLSAPVVTARRPSAHGGDLYAAVAERADRGGAGGAR